MSNLENSFLELLNKAIQTYDKDEVTPLERQIVDKMLVLAIENYSRDIKKRLADDLQKLSKLSPEIASLWANDDDDEIALAILEHSPALGDDTIKDILYNNNVSYYETASKRDNLSADITSILVNYSVENNNIKIVENITSNQTAVINKDSFQKITDSFVHALSIQENLCFRIDLPKTIAVQLFGIVDEQLKGHLLENTDISEAEIEALVETTSDSIAEDQAFIKRSGAIKQANQTVIDDIVGAILMPLCNGCKRTFVKNLAELIYEPEFIVEQALLEPSVMPIILENLALTDEYKQALESVAGLYRQYDQKYSMSLAKDSKTFLDYLLKSDVVLPEREHKLLVKVGQV